MMWPSVLRRKFCDHPHPQPFPHRGGRETISLTRHLKPNRKDQAAIPWATGGTAFQQSVWTALAEIPPGQTSTYAAVAERIGKPSAVRAVGAANGANPIAIRVPCHRLIGASGALTGYAGGLARKAWLLAHEGALRP